MCPLEKNSRGWRTQTFRESRASSLPQVPVHCGR
jgi:hypothetical protein